MVSDRQPKQRLKPDSRLTEQQAVFAKLIASGLNSAASCYRLAYKIKSTTDWTTRQRAYNLLQKPHVQALVTKLKLQYESVRPSLTRVSKREILHGMAVDDTLDPVDRQRAVDIDNKMQGEYQERMHLTADVSVSMFRSSGAIPWQLAETIPDVSASGPKAQAIIDVCSTPVVMTPQDGGQGTLAIRDSADAPQSHAKALSSSPESEPAQPANPSAITRPARKGKQPASKLTALQASALRAPRAKR